MKALLALSFSGVLLAGCASTESDRVTRTDTGAPLYGLDDQPQTAVAGEGSLMPGAYSTRAPETGQFTGRERTNDQIGQRSTLPREADPRELARDDDIGETGKGAGTLGQSGVVPGQPVTGETLLEEPAPTGASAHAVVIPPGVETELDPDRDEAVGSAAGPETGSERNQPPE